VGGGKETRHHTNYWNNILIRSSICLFQLAVIIASLAQDRSSLAVGNVVGSTISNILGAFSLGLLLLPPGLTTFDTSSRIYTALLFLVTSCILGLYLGKWLGKTAGVMLVSMFVVYLASVSWWIYKGFLTVPEDLDSDSDGDSDSSDNGDQASPAYDTRPHSSHMSESSPLLSATDLPNHNRDQPKPGTVHSYSLTYHILQLLLGFVTLSLSGYILSHSAASLCDAFHLSGTVLGLTILSFATTLPEKFVAVLSGTRGHAGILVANTAGSNVFLLTLCLGIILLASDGVGFDGDGESSDSLNLFDLGAMWLSSAILFLVVCLGARRWIGGVLILLYIAFLVAEFTLYRR
jgi:Ca2+/H+ antiporter